MQRVLLLLTLSAATVLTAPAAASAPPVGPLPRGPVVTITVPRGTLFALALPSRPVSTGLVWRAATGANPAVPRIVRPLWESDVGASVAVVYTAVAAGKATLAYGLTRGETWKAFASLTYKVTVVAPRTTATARAAAVRFRTPPGFIRRASLSKSGDFSESQTRRSEVRPTT